MSNYITELIAETIAVAGSAIIIIGSYLFSGCSSSRSAQSISYSSRTAATGAIYGTDYCLDAVWNSLRISGVLYADTIDDNHIIYQFYVQRNVLSTMKHACVVFQANYKQNYKCHLIWNTEKDLMILVEETDWRPSQDTMISPCRTSIRNLKNYIINYRQQFGHYVMGLRDCRHVANDIADFLTLSR